MHSSANLHPRFGVFSGYAYTINSVIGAGFLSIPWAYQNGGWALALAMQISFLAVGWLLSHQLLEITSCVTVLRTASSKKCSVSFWTAMRVAFGAEHSDRMRLLDMPDPEISENLQFDLYEIVKILMGPYWAGVYMLLNSVFLLSSLTAYTNIFATGFGSYLHVFASCDYSQTELSSKCEWQYSFFLLVFFLLMAYFSSIEFHEQKLMQVTMTLMRLFVMSTVIIVSVLDLLQRKNLDNDGDYRHGNPEVADFATIGKTMPIVLFAGIYQPYYPGILASIRKDPPTLHRILLFVTLTLLVFYSLLGLSTAFSIAEIPSNVSLAFADFSSGYSQATRPAWTYVISYLIVLFPAIDVISIFPLLAHAISDNILSAIYSADRLAVRFTAKFAYYGIRIASIVPAFVYAFFEVKLGPIVNNSGLLCFYLTFFMIPLLHIAARFLVPKESPYTVRLNPLWLSALITLLSVPLFLLNAYTALYSEST